MPTPKSTPRTPRTLLSPAGLHILLALSGEDRHGYAIKQDIEARTGGTLGLGPATLYEAIHRMVASGLIAETRRSVAATEDRRKIYALTAEGRRTLTAELARLDDIVRFARARALLGSSRRS